MSPEQRKFHGRKPHTPGRKHAEGTVCSAGGVTYLRKDKAEKASPTHQAKKCGRCKQWHPVL